MAHSGASGAASGVRAALVLGWVLSSVFLSGCEGDEPNSSTEIFCTAMCERSVQCGGWKNAGSCESSCQSNPEVLEDFRPDFIAEFARCFRRLSCSDFFLENSFDPCWAEAREGFAPNADTRAFCGDYTRAWFECGSFYFPDECERDWASSAAPRLDRIAQCDQSVACDELPTCIDRALEAGR